MMAERPIRVLIIDDSALFRRFLAQGIKSDPEFELVGTAANAEQARQFIGIRRPDVISLDIEMPQMDGLTFLKEEISKDPIPTVIVSSQTTNGARATIEALQAGAVDVLPKPKMVAGQDIAGITSQIRFSLKAARHAHIQNAEAPQCAQPVKTANRPTAPAKLSSSNPAQNARWVFAIGASTGGVQALGTLLAQLPADAPPTVVVQHMPEGFTNAFARRLNDMCQVEVREAKQGDELRQGLVLLAPGGERHMAVKPGQKGLCVRLNDGAPVCYSRPSVDVLFASVANCAAPNVTGVLLTGMGRDGAQSLGMIRHVGGRTFAQDQASSVVWGMPAAAWEAGAVEALVSLNDMAGMMMSSIGVAPPRPPEDNIFSRPLRKGN